MTDTVENLILDLLSWRLPLETRRRIREAEETGATALDLSHVKALLENIPLRVLASRKDVGHAQ
jgi:hypothetical protein